MSHQQSLFQEDLLQTIQNAEKERQEKQNGKEKIKAPEQVHKSTSGRDKNVTYEQKIAYFLSITRHEHITY